jgi:hypothetical protein
LASDFEGIENARVSEKLPRFNPGSYLLETQALKMITTRTKGKMFVSEWKILEATGPHANPPGSQASNVVKMSLDTALGHVKGVAAAILNKTDKEITAKKVEELVADKNPAKGVRVRAEASIITTKAGTPFTLLKFYPA